MKIEIIPETMVPLTMPEIETIRHALRFTLMIEKINDKELLYRLRDLEDRFSSAPIAVEPLPKTIYK